MARQKDNYLTPKKAFTILMALSAVCILIPERITGKVDQAVSSILSPFNKSAYNLASKIPRNNGEQNLVSGEKYRQTLDQLKRTVNFLNNVTQELNYQKERIRQLSDLRPYLSMEQIKLLPAHAISGSTSVTGQIIKLDHGSDSQVRPGQIVLSTIDGKIEPTEKPDNLINKMYQTAVVGRVKTVSKNSCDLQLITDPKFKAPVSIESNWQRQKKYVAEGVLTAHGMGLMSVNLVDTSFPVKVGDTVMLKASNETLPIDVVIGYVSECKYDDENGVLWDIKIAPAVDLNKINDVIIVNR